MILDAHTKVARAYQANVNCNPFPTNFTTMSPTKRETHYNLQSRDRSPYHLRMHGTTNKTQRPANKVYPRACNNRVQNTIPTLQPSIKPQNHNRNRDCRHKVPLIPSYKNKHARSDEAQSGGRGRIALTWSGSIDLIRRIEWWSESRIWETEDWGMIDCLLLWLSCLKRFSSTFIFLIYLIYLFDKITIKTAEMGGVGK